MPDRLEPAPTCPSCSEILDGYTGVTDPDAMPTAGDYSVCAYCSTVLRFTRGCGKCDPFTGHLHGEAGVMGETCVSIGCREYEHLFLERVSEDEMPEVLAEYPELPHIILDVTRVVAEADEL